MRPRIRTLKPEMWQDEHIGELSHGSRLLFIGLITMADDEGRLRELPAAILGHVFPYDAISNGRLGRWLSEIEKTGMIVRYSVDKQRFIAFRRWSRHQKVDRPSPSTFPEPSSNHRRTFDGSSIPTRARASGPVRSLPDPSSKSQPSELATRCEPYAAISRRLAEQILNRDPQAKVAPDSQRWLNAVRLLVEQDGRSLEQINAVLNWLPSHRSGDFTWSAVVLSMPKFREKFTQLVAAMGRPSSAPVALSDYDQRRAERGAALKDRMKRTGAAL